MPLHSWLPRTKITGRVPAVILLASLYIRDICHSVDTSFIMSPFKMSMSRSSPKYCPAFPAPLRHSWLSLMLYICSPSEESAGRKV